MPGIHLISKTRQQDNTERKKWTTSSENRYQRLTCSAGRELEAWNPRICGIFWCCVAPGGIEIWNKIFWSWIETDIKCMQHIRLTFALRPKDEFHDTSETLRNIIGATIHHSLICSRGYFGDKTQWPNTKYRRHSGQIPNTEDIVAKYRPKSHNFYLYIVLSRPWQG